jgi:hypothetical protein
MNRPTDATLGLAMPDVIVSIGEDEIKHILFGDAQYVVVPKVMRSVTKCICQHWGHPIW